MDTRKLRTCIEDNPAGVEIRMVNGTVYRTPHRNFIWFTPAYGQPESRVGRMATSFWLHDAQRDETRLVNSLLVAEVIPLSSNGGGCRGKSRKSPK